MDVTCAITSNYKPLLNVNETEVLLLQIETTLGLILVQVQLRQKYYTLQVRRDRRSNSWPPDHGQQISCPWDTRLNHGNNIVMMGAFSFCACVRTIRQCQQILVMYSLHTYLVCCKDASRQAISDILMNGLISTHTMQQITKSPQKLVTKLTLKVLIFWKIYQLL